MGAVNRLASGLAIYIGYQILTKKKYSGLRHQLLEEFGKSKSSIVDFLDKMDLYLTVPTNVDVDKNRIAIEDEIRKLRSKIKNIDSDKIAKHVADVAAASVEVIGDSITRTKKSK